MPIRGGNGSILIVLLVVVRTPRTHCPGYPDNESMVVYPPRFHHISFVSNHSSCGISCLVLLPIIAVKPLMPLGL